MSSTEFDILVWLTIGGAALVTYGLRIGGLLLDERSGVSYPDGQQTADGLIRIIYDYSRTGSRHILMATFREEDVAAGKLDPEGVDEETLPRYLDTCLLPDPDLVIRTSGEARISNFLLWQSAYAELYFTDRRWPDFTTDDFDRAVAWYHRRNRTFGLVEAVG